MKKNKFLACFVALATLLSGLPAFVQAAEAVEPLSIVHDFDDWTEVPIHEDGDEWYIFGQREGYATSTVTPNTDGKQIDVAYSAAPASNYGNQSTVFKRQNLSIKERVVIEENVRPGAVGGVNGAYVSLLQLTDAGGTTFSPLSARTGVFTVKGGTNATYTANKWYNLKLVLEYDETESKFTTYDLYINDVLYADDVTLETCAPTDFTPRDITEITAVTLVNCTPFNATSYSFDNFTIKALADGENPIKPLSIVHDFNKISTDEDGAPIFDSNWKITNGEGYATTTVSTSGTDSQIDVAYSTVPSSKWGGADRTKFVRQNLSIKERFVIEENVRPNTVSGSNPNTGAHVQFLQLTDVSGTTISPLTARGGTFTVTGGTSTKYAANRWYNLKMVLDYDKTTSKFTSYDLYINDALYANDVALTDITEITEVALVNCTPYAKTSYTFDDFSIKAIGDGNYKQYYLYNDYEDEKITGDDRGYISLGGLNVFSSDMITEDDGNRYIQFTSGASNGTSMQVTAGNASSYPLAAAVPCTFQYRFKLSSTYGNLYPMRVIAFSDGTQVSHGDKIDRTNYPTAWDWSKWNELKVNVLEDKIEYYVNDVLYKTYTPAEGTSYAGLNVTQVEMFSENYVPVNATISIDDIMAYPYTANTDYFYDNFDYTPSQDFAETGVITATNHAKPWQITSYSQYNSLKVVPLDEFDSNKVLQFTTQYDSSVGYKDLTLLAPLNDVSGKVAFEQRIKLSRGDTRAVIFRLFDGNNKNFDTVMIQNYKLKAGGTNIADIENNTWYTIKVVANISGNGSQSDTYDVYLNGEEVATNLPLINGNAGPASAIKKFIPLSYQEIDFQSIAQVDYIRVSEVPLDPSEITLDVDLTVTNFEGSTSFANLWTGDDVTITADVSNSTDSALTPILFVALYDTNNNLKFLCSDKAETELAIGESETLELLVTPTAGENLILKAFVWEGTDNLRPSEIAVHNVLN